MNFFPKRHSHLQWVVGVDISPMYTRAAEISYKNMNFFVKTHLSSPKRSRGKEFSKIGDQSHFSCPAESVRNIFLTFVNSALS